MRATDSLRAMDTFRGSLPRAKMVHWTPTLARVSVQSFRMSSDLLVKKYRGYSYRFPFRTVQLVIRHPSE